MVRPFALSDPYLLAILRISAILAMASLRRQACHQDFPRCHLIIPRTTTDPSVRLSSTGPKDGNCQGQRQLRPELVSGMARSVTTRKANIPIAIIKCLQGGNKISHDWKVFKLKWWTEVFSAVIQFPYLCIWCNQLLFRAVLKFWGISRSTLISSAEAAILLVSDGRQKGPLVTRLRVQDHKCEAWNRDCACVRLFLWQVLKSDTFQSCPKTLYRDCRFDF